MYTLAAMTRGWRSQRLYTLAGVTYNEWIGLGGDAEAVEMKWLLDYHKELEVGPLSIYLSTIYLSIHPSNYICTCI